MSTFKTIAYEFDELEELDDKLYSLVKQYNAQVVSVSINERGRNKRIGEHKYKAFLVLKVMDFVYYAD